MWKAPILAKPPPPDASFADHFSRQAKDYARHRPRYPAALFSELAALAPRQKLAWDCGTGSGQAAGALRQHFERVVGTDASAEQIEYAHSYDGVEYRVASAEQSGLEAGSVDLCLAAAAAHWFEHDAFHQELRRACRPGAVVALFSYNASVRATPPVEQVVARWSDEVLADDWPAQIELIRGRYADLPFPFAEVAIGEHACSASWSLDDAVGVFSTWSATQRALERTGEDLCAQFRAELSDAWPTDTPLLDVEMPLFFRIGRV